MAVTVEPLDGDLKRQSPVVWQQIEINAIRYNQAASFTLTLPANDRNWDLIGFGEGGGFLPVPIAIDWNGVLTFSGLAQQWGYTLATDDETGLVTETITLTGQDWLALLASRIVYRDADAAWTSQTAGSTTLTDTAETLIKTLVTSTLVESADTDRNVPNLTVATDQERGGTVSYQVISPQPTSETDVQATLGDTLMDMIRKVAAQSNIGVKIDLIDDGLVFDCFVPRDLTETVVFSRYLGNLRGAQLGDTTPAANVALIQSGATSGAFTSAHSGAGWDDPWRRAEVWVDQSSTTDATQITQAGRDALAEGAGQTQLQVTTVDTPRLRFGADDTDSHIQGYAVGDKVSVELREGVVYSDVISQVALTADTTGDTYVETVTPTVGAADDSSADDDTAQAALAAQVRTLQKKLKGA